MTSFSGRSLFYPVVALLTLVDYTFITGVVWLSLKVTGSSLPLGFVLCFSIAIPFILEMLLGERVTRVSVGRLAYMRILMFGAVATLAWLGVAGYVTGFLLLALAVGIVDYFTVTAFESWNARMVVDGLVTASQAAKRIQTAIQVGGLGGSMLGGALLGLLDGGTFLVDLGLAGAVASLVLLRLDNDRAKKTVADVSAATSPKQSASIAPTLSLGRNTATGLLICLALIAFHIGAFNSMLPLVYQQVNGWDSTAFGTASGIAGVGAFLAAVLPMPRINRLVAPLLLVGVDMILVWSPITALSVIAAFFVGFATNLLRISVREELIAKARSDADAEWIGSRSAYASLSMQAFAALFLTFLTSQEVLSARHAPLMLVLSALLLAVGMSLIQGPLWRQWTVEIARE
ncbi:MAG TPA: hypothetical protein VI653_29710 [Steroidobacteraceae bacterium]